MIPRKPLMLRMRHGNRLLWWKTMHVPWETRGGSITMIGVKFLETTGQQATKLRTSFLQVWINKMTVEVPNNIGMNLEDLFPLDEGAAESISISVAPLSKPISAKSKGKKRKQGDDDDDAIVEAINNFADVTKNTMTNLIKQLAAKASYEKMSAAQEKVLDAMESIPELTEDEKVSVTEILVDNHKKLSLFLRYGHGGRLSLARKLLRGG